MRAVGTDKHGTTTGYDWHNRHHDPPCEPCRAAKREQSKTLARQKREREQADAPRKAAWQKACSRLAERHPVEFREILLEEMRGAVVLPPEDEGTTNEM